MYSKIVIDRYNVSVVSMEKMNVSPSKDKTQAISTTSSEEKDKKYYYNQLRKRRDIISLIKMNFQENNSCFITLTFSDTTISLDQARIKFERFIKQLRV